MTRATDDELEGMAKRLESVCIHLPLSQPRMRDAAAMLRACKGGAVKAASWYVDESKYGTLIYSLKQDGWRKGEPTMVNDVTIRIENANGSNHDLRPIATRILSALEPAPDAWQEGWRAGIEAAKVAMGEYHWNRYRTRDQGGELAYPAVFSSHTWQDVQDVLDTLAEKGPSDE